MRIGFRQLHIACRTNYTGLYKEGYEEPFQGITQSLKMKELTLVIEEH